MVSLQTRAAMTTRSQSAFLAGVLTLSHCMTHTLFGSQTNAYNASVTVSFHGNAVALYGGTAPTHGLYEVSLDDAPPQTFNGSAPVNRPGMLLVRRYFCAASPCANTLTLASCATQYLASGLTDGAHRVKMANVDPAGQWLDFERADIFDWSGCCATQASTLSPTSTGFQQSSFLRQTSVPLTSPAAAKPTPSQSKYVEKLCSIFYDGD